MNLQLYRINQLRQNLEKAALAIEDDRSSYHYKTLLEALQKQCDKVEEGHFSICEEENILEHSYFQDEVFENLKTDYDSIIEQLYEKLQQHQPVHKASVKIPKIVIPILTGSYESWSSFYDLFLKIIHEDNSLTDTEKMQYLKTHVKDDAAKLIRHLTVCESNYATAWTLLKKRYENERMIITKHIDNILNIQKVKCGIIGKHTVVAPSNEHVRKTINTAEVGSACDAKQRIGAARRSDWLRDDATHATHANFAT
ncbi:uncharacterized protein LOC142985881 [Anticarsia gemmatalis]|uniref:uncharacterized protein LOC142985881 n=1 Tax=Anticarsia gemmatalis TaxID=129554 RepID=UPI003F7584ED